MVRLVCKKKSWVERAAPPRPPVDIWGEASPPASLNARRGIWGGWHIPPSLLLCFLLAIPALAASPDDRADALVSQMTTAEKLTLLHGPFAAAKPRPTAAIGSAGYLPGIGRLGIPALQETDAGLGVTNPYDIRPGDTAVALPSGLAMAATFDPLAAYAGGAVLGREAAARGFNVVLGGGANLVRDPRGGRQFEYAGEDPLLAGVMAGAAIRGTQDQHVVSTVKHFAVNDQESGRMVLSANMPEAALRESDLLAFEIAIEQGHPGAVMCAYNRVNSVYACENPGLLIRALKQDWHYPGWVMSDWGAVHSVIAIDAGLDQESGEQFDSQVFFGAPLQAALASGQVKQARVDDAARRIVRSMDVAGLLDRKAAAHDDSAADVETARRNAAEGMVLLANRDVLPLSRGLKRVCVFGGNADAGVAAGGGSSQVTPPGGYARAIPLGGLVQPSSFSTQVYDPPSPLSRLEAKISGAKFVFDDGRYPAHAAMLATLCEVSVVFVQQFAGEEHDVPDLSLPAGQDALVAAVTHANPRTVVVLETAGAVKMPWLAQAGAVVEAWYPGSGGADAIANVLFGDVSPSGRLPVTFPLSENDLPNLVLPGLDAPEGRPFQVLYPEEAAVGYRWFAQRKIRPLFPFGFGLSFTHFDYTNLRVTGGRSLVVEFDVRNTGKKRGTDVPQVYLTARDGTRVLRLLGWSRESLQPGETRHERVQADLRLVADFDALRRRWVVPAGQITVGVGRDSGAVTQQARVTLNGVLLPP